MCRKIPHLLILIYRARVNVEKRYAEKTTQKMDFTGVEIAQVDVKSYKYRIPGDTETLLALFDCHFSRTYNRSF